MRNAIAMTMMMSGLAACSASGNTSMVSARCTVVDDATFGIDASFDVALSSPGDEFTATANVPGDLTHISDGTPAMFGCGVWSPILDLGCVRSQGSPDEQTIRFTLQGVYDHPVFANGGSIYVDVRGVAVTAAGVNEGTDGERLTCAR